MTKSATHIFRVALQDEPSVYRDIEIDSGKSLYKLAEAIVESFDFMFDHCFGFYSGTGKAMMKAQPQYELFADIGEDSEAGSVKKTRVADAFPEVGRAMTFLFDYGDGWLFRVKMVGTGQMLPKTRYPKVLAVAGPSPEQYPAYDEDDEDGS